MKIITLRKAGVFFIPITMVSASIVFALKKIN